MTGNLKQITSSQLDKLIIDPSLLMPLLYPEFYPQSETEKEEKLVSSEEEISKLDLGSDYLALHYLITGSEEGGSPPLVYAIFGKTPLGEVTDFGPPAQYLSPSEVKEVAEALLNITDETFKARYSPQSLAGEFYPYKGLETGQENLLDQFLDIYKEVLNYYETAAKNRNAMLYWIS